MKPMLVVLVLGSFLALMENVVGAATGMIVGETVSTNEQFGASAQVQQVLLAQGLAAGTTFVTFQS